MPASNAKYWMGFDLGGTKMMATVFDRGFRPVTSFRAKTKVADGRELIAKLVGTIESTLRSARIRPSQLSGIGIGIPGPLDLDRGILLQAPNLGCRNLPLKSLLEKRFKCSVTVINDVDAGTYGEYRFGAAKRARCVLGVFPGTGMGGSCIYQGHIVRGKTGSCMEIGHMIVQPGGRLCGCGQRGCLETVSSRLAISADVAMAAYRGEAPHLVEMAGMDLSQIKSSVLAKSIKAGDTAVEKIVVGAARNLGQAIANVVNLLAPDVVLLGGGIVAVMPDIFVGEVRRAIDKYAMRGFVKGVKVVEAKLGDAAGVMGAAALAADAAG